MPSLQDWIHKLEEGAGARYLKIIAFCVAILFLTLIYNLCAYRNFATPEAMDSAQLARNLAEGKGYTTLFIRPFSLYLVQEHNQTPTADTLTSAGTDFAKIKTAHPDIANPPVYPIVLAGLMKVLPFHYPLNLKNAFWSNSGNFWRYEPDFLIAMFNEVLLLMVVIMTFFLARKLFDAHVAWLSAFLVLGCELLWRFSVVRPVHHVADDHFYCTDMVHLALRRGGTRRRNHNPAGCWDWRSPPVSWRAWELSPDTRLAG